MELINKQKLINKGNKQGRQIACDIIEYTLNNLDPYKKTKQIIKREGNILKIKKQKFNLDKINNIYIIGAGKATYPIAFALEEILQEKITKGLVILKGDYEEKLKYIDIISASHPLPDQMSLQGAKEILKIVDNSEKDDIVFSIMTGGSSSLMVYPPKGITLNELKELNKVLLYSGANIYEINTIRKHISRVKGGKLAEHIFPSHLINLTVSDVIGDELDYITGPTVPDSSTIEDTINVLNKYNFWDKIPANICKYFNNLSLSNETPKTFKNEGQILNVILIKTRSVTLLAKEKAKQLGLNYLNLSSFFEGNSQKLGEFFAAITNEVNRYNEPIPKPCVIIGGGETIVEIHNEECGLGGPNQEFAISALLRINNLENIVIVGLDTDGTDGPTEYAGVMADVHTLKEAERNKINLKNALFDHDITNSLKKLNCLIYTGDTGTNVNDLKMVIIL